MRTVVVLIVAICVGGCTRAYYRRDADRETYGAIKETRSRFPAPVDTMDCNTAVWKEMGPRVGDTLIIVRVPDFSTDSRISLNALYRPPPPLFFTFDESRTSDSRRPSHSRFRRKPRMIDVTVDKLRAAHGGKFSLEATDGAGRMDLVLAATIVAGAVGYLINEGLERLVAWWRRQRQAESK